jgi:hypothetical protein
MHAPRLLFVSRRGMPSPSRLVRTGAVVAAWLVLALTILAASPQAHALLHHDADHADHACGVTLAQQGFCDSAASAPLLIAPETVLTVLTPRPASHGWSVPDYWQPPGQAPPTGRR